MKIEVGRAYKDGNGKVVVIVGEHPWSGKLVGALVDGTVRKYDPQTGWPEWAYGDGQIKALAD